MSDFGNIVRELGEDLIFETQTIKSSLKSSTSAIYSLANRACFVEGQTIKGSPQIANGDYFERPSDNSTYFVATLMAEPQADDLFYMYAIKCNVSISIKRYFEPDRDEYTGELIGGGWNDIYTDVKCFRDIETHSYNSTSDGELDQTVYSLIIPHRYLISENDRVVMMSNKNGQEILTNYRVESVGNQVEGIDLVRMTLDLR